jgi:hypothetical protein
VGDIAHAFLNLTVSRAGRLNRQPLRPGALRLKPIVRHNGAGLKALPTGRGVNRASGGPATFRSGFVISPQC